MDTNKQSSFVNYIPHTLAPAQLWIGQHTQTIQDVELFLKKILCKNSSCDICIACMQIKEKQHHAIMWLYPEKNYTIDQFDDLFTTLSFQLQPEELFFFIIQKSDFLSPACANKLLKSMEEPPPGYHFILLAERIEQILPTIRSRCVIYSSRQTVNQNSSHPFFECFTTKAATSEEFSKLIDATTIHERESIEVATAILHHWMNIYKKENLSPTKNHAIVRSIVTTINRIILQPPMPGSSTIFWRNFYLQLHDYLKIYLCSSPTSGLSA